MSADTHNQSSMSAEADTTSRGASRVPYASHPIVYGLLRFAVNVVVRILYRYRVRGIENVPATGPTMFVINHLHLFDPVAVGAAINRQVVVLAADKWADHWFVRGFLGAVGVIYVRRGEPDRAALKACLEVIRAGGALAVAPEGTRSRRGFLQRAKPGVAFIATRTNPTIVPVACWGVERLRDWRKLKRPDCTVAIGKPFSLPTSDTRPTTDQLQVYTDEIMVHIAELLPESYRGVYASLDAARILPAPATAMDVEGQG